MGRRQVKSNAEAAAMEDKYNLSAMADKYGLLKEQEAELKKEIKPLNDDIKKAMGEYNLDGYIANNFTVKISERKNEDFNEAKALDILKENLTPEQQADVIKVKEYIDDDALESLVYNGEFDLHLLDGCKIVKAPTITLRVSRNKNN